MFGLRDVQIIDEVARQAGIRAAAGRLGLAPSAISARIAQLEQAFGVALLERSRRGVRLTPAGRRFLEQAQRLLILRDEIAIEFTADAALNGTLRIGVAETVVHTSLPRLLERLTETAPRIRLELSVDVSQQLSRALLDNAIDIAILMRQWVPQGAQATEIERVALGWFAAPALVAQFAAGAGSPVEPDRMDPPSGTAEGVPLDRRVLDGRSVITFSRGTPPACEVDGFFRDARFRGPVIHSSSALATMVHLTCSGLGIGTLPLKLVEMERRDGRLQRIDFGPRLALSPLVFDLCFISPSIARLAAILTDRDAGRAELQGPVATSAPSKSATPGGSIAVKPAPASR